MGGYVFCSLGKEWDVGYWGVRYMLCKLGKCDSVRRANDSS